MGVTLFPNGVSNAAANSYADKADLPIPDPTKFIEYFNDFMNYVASDWVVTDVGAATQALQDSLGGALLLTNAAGDDNSSFLQLVGEAFQWASDKQMWFKARLATDDAADSDIVIGLQITDTTPLDVTDQIAFVKSDGVATVDFLIEKDDTATTLSNVATMAADTFIELAFYYDGESRFFVYVDDALVAETNITTNAPDDELLTISFGIQNGEAAAKSLAIDYVLAVGER